MIMVSIIGEPRFRSLWRLLSKTFSIAAFVTGTAMLASVTLVPLHIAIMVLLVMLCAGVWCRAITGWMVSLAFETEPMIHVISDTRSEASQAIREILSMPFQVETNGHVFIKQRRVAKRSPWFVKIMGLLASPYDLRKACRPVSSKAEDDSFLETGSNATGRESKAPVLELNLGSHESTAFDMGR